jgi:dTDP-4-dehydrorhamnose reductase
MRKILVTGSNGLLGQKLVYALAAHPDFQLIATSTGANRVRLKEGYTYQSLDITNKDQVETVFNQYAPDVVINTAAMTNVDACETDRAGCWKLNVDAVQYLADACKKHDAHFIHLSTDFVFDGEAGPYKETDQPAPVSYYGDSKYAAEKVVQQSGLKQWSIARTIIVYGIVDNMSRSNVVLWAKGALEKGEPIRVVDDQFRSPTLAEDLAAGCILLAEKQATGIYHLSGKEGMSILELVYKVADYFDLDPSIVTSIKSETLNQPAKRPPRTGFILDKAVNDLGYNPRTFEEGLSVLEQQLTN